METKNANGGAGFTEYNDGTIQSKQHNGVRDIMTTERIWQTFTLPEGKYEMRIEVKNAANIGSGKYQYPFCCSSRRITTDNEELEKSQTLSSLTSNLSQNILIKHLPYLYLN